MELVRGSQGWPYSGDYPQPTAPFCGGAVPKGGVAMFQTASLQQVIAQAAYKAAHTGKREVGVIVKAPLLPPSPPFKTIKVETAYGTVRVTALPMESGDWRVFVKFPTVGSFKLSEHLPSSNNLPPYQPSNSQT
jgi:hypothetical protein